MTFEPRTAVEFLSLQNNERTHAEFLAWLVSRHAGLGDQSVALLAHLLGPDWFSGETLRVKRVATETTVGEEGKKKCSP
jgi:hypothetical protein